MRVGDVISATVPWAKENPVIAPHVLRLTRAVAFLAGCTKSPSSTIHLVFVIGGGAGYGRLMSLIRPG